MRKLLAVFAHPDDEAFGPGGTLAKYGNSGVEIHILSATRGEAGKWHEKKFKVQSSKFPAKQDLAPRDKIQNEKEKIKISEEVKLHHVREKELLKSAEVLGIKKVEFLDFIDGTLCNAIYHQLADKIMQKINSFKPQVVLTIDRLGVSGHLDHIAVSLTTTYAFLNTDTPKKLYYHCLAKENRDKELDRYFIYFPEGYDQKEITTRIDWGAYWDKKVEAMKQHKSQTHDVKRILLRIKNQPRVDHFILQYYRGIVPKFPESDLFEGISS